MHITSSRETELVIGHRELSDWYKEKCHIYGLHFSNVFNSTSFFSFPQTCIHQEELASRKACFIKEVLVGHKEVRVPLPECAPISVLGQNELTSIKELSSSDENAEICFYASSVLDEAFVAKLQSDKFNIIYIGSKIEMTFEGIVFIDNLDELIITMSSVIKKGFSSVHPLTVGYLMKPSRELDFLKRGALPLFPCKSALIFIPISFELPLISQLERIDVILHKVTDEIVSIDPSSSFEFPKGITFSKGMSELIRFIEEHPYYCVVDPFKNIYPLLDRLQIQNILVGLQDIKSSSRLRAPHFLRVQTFNDPDLGLKLAEANLKFPVLVKPQVACGVADAHNMAIVFKAEDFRELSVPLPAIIQEYVDHGASIYKVYVIGKEVFHAVRKSLPNSTYLLASSQKSSSSPITFNSLKSLPVPNQDESSMNDAFGKNKKSLDMNLFNAAAHWMRQQLGLTIFGFDVVIQENSGDHVIVDLNYLPTFKEVTGLHAISAFWEAIRSAYEVKKAANVVIHS
ncbi:Inositol-tetrakisphosphate 1-kinase [Rhynchospora pubera]|uniref:Inositol-tetrakisphosphate 1-kinase 6 n=1 Tax=Rhynchospora pubera TaxID=906938 RepID=A0AAV8EB80_9POAL|nr:Inositol-tetrakisphosphate 1-kinase [Rhynchospora pubera]